MGGRDNQFQCPILSEGHRVFERIWRIYLILDLTYYISADDSSLKHYTPTDVISTNGQLLLIFVSAIVTVF